MATTRVALVPISATFLAMAAATILVRCYRELSTKRDQTKETA